MAFDASRSEREAKPVVRQRMPLGRTRRRLSFERRVRLWLTAAAVPLLTALAFLCKRSDLSRGEAALLLVGAAMGWALAASYFFESLIRPLQTLSNIVAALREEDFAFRARGARRGDALGDLALEINALAGTLQHQRNAALDALALADRVMSSMQSPVLAFDAGGALRLLNAAAGRVFSLQRDQVLGRSTGLPRLQGLLEQVDESVYALQNSQGGGTGTRWSVRRSAFRLHGVPHTLFVLSDVAAALQEEERVAWQRLIRVLGHEINNSLTPIKSIAGTLRSRSPQHTAASHLPGWEDVQRGLTVIEERADSLNRFIEGYQQLSRLPPPRRRPVDLRGLIAQTLPLEHRLNVHLEDSLPDVEIQADGDQLQQLLINLLKNAADAALDPELANPAPRVLIGWTQADSHVVIRIQDNGPGLANPGNLFVPFYTTKPDGAGIGLTLSRQIASAHHGSILLRNREGAAGCIVEISLPLAPDFKSNSY